MEHAQLLDLIKDIENSGGLYLMNINADIQGKQLGIKKTAAIVSILKAATQVKQVPCPVCGGEAIHAMDILKRTVIKSESVKPFDLNDPRPIWEQGR